MLLEASDDAIEAFIWRKKNQGFAAMATLKGLSLVMSGERMTSISLHSGDGEAVIIGQMPHYVETRTGSARNPVRRDAANTKKPPERRAIDLSDEQVAAIVDAWRSGRSALGLPGVAFVYDAAGKIKE